MADKRNARGRLNVLAVIEEPDTTRQCLIAAARAAAVDTRATLTALHIEVDPKHIRAAPEEVSVQQQREPHEGSAHDRAVHVRRIFEFWFGANPSPLVFWRKITGTIDSTLTEEARDADLIVICQPRNLDSTDALHAGIFHSGKPVLFVPRGPLRSIKLDHLAIAWKDTPQANKVVEQARPWLAAAQHVSALTVDDATGSRDTARLEHEMSRFGVPIEVHHLHNKPGDHTATTLLTGARRLEADALVMGAFRFGQVLEWVFGGVTSEILRRSPLPVFLAH